MRYQATYLRTALRLDYKMGVQYGLFFEVGQAWSDLPGDSRTGATKFGSHGTDVTLTFSAQGDPATSPSDGLSWSLEPFVRLSRLSRSADHYLFDGGLHLVLLH